MPNLKLIAKEFDLGIITEKLGKPINHVAFAKKTNKNQQSKFFKRMAKMEARRKSY
jgi:hypothetical protein